MAISSRAYGKIKVYQHGGEKKKPFYVNLWREEVMGEGGWMLEGWGETKSLYLVSRQVWEGVWPGENEPRKVETTIKSEKVIQNL